MTYRIASLSYFLLVSLAAPPSLAGPPTRAKLPSLSKEDAAKELKKHIEKKGLYCEIRTTRNESNRVHTSGKGTPYEMSVEFPEFHSCYRYRVGKIEGAKVQRLALVEVKIYPRSGRTKVDPGPPEFELDIDLNGAVFSDPNPYMGYVFRPEDKWTDRKIVIVPREPLFVHRYLGKSIGKPLPINPDGPHLPFHSLGFETEKDAEYARTLLVQLAGSDLLHLASSGGAMEVDAEAFDVQRDFLDMSGFEIDDDCRELANDLYAWHATYELPDEIVRELLLGDPIDNNLMTEAKIALNKRARRMRSSSVMARIDKIGMVLTAVKLATKNDIQTGLALLRKGKRPTDDQMKAVWLYSVRVNAKFGDQFMSSTLVNYRLGNKPMEYQGYCGLLFDTVL